MVGFAEANHDNPVQTTLLFDAHNIDGYSYDYRDNSRLPLITYGTTDVTNPATWTLTQIRLRPQSTINSFQTASLDFEWAASDAFTLKFGPQWKNYVFKSTEARRSNGTTANHRSRDSGRSRLRSAATARSPTSAAVSTCRPAASRPG